MFEICQSLRHQDSSGRALLRPRSIGTPDIMVTEMLRLCCKYSPGNKACLLATDKLSYSSQHWQMHGAAPMRTLRSNDSKMRETRHLPTLTEA